MHVLVTGANGFVGRRLTPALVAAGHDVTALVRDASAYDAPDGVRVVEGDLLDPATARPAFDGVEAAFYLVHSMTAGGDFEERDRRIAESFADMAAAAGVARVVYLGGLGADADDLSPHLRSRREVETVLRDAAYDLTVLRAAIVVGAGSVGFDIVVQLAKRLPIMTTPRWVRTPCQPIASADLVAYLVGVLDHPETAGETYEVGGPDVLTYEAMIRRVAALLGKHPVVLPVPVLSPGLSAHWVDLVTDVPREVAHPLIEGMKNPVVVTDDRIRDVVPVELTSFDDAATAALRAMGEGVRR
ncbi:NAD(P)H-binding protein [Halocalculus aciditolerans]|uniref:NADH-binding protein n=1 Tax=Halocalculus aciditolerans TaxID=1383812 RepID=A0A830FH16_9EURY|nr:NAD(P)H-binding protein [Halocalculus aciditolerans]GGL46502.1 NADH-binding protein [Halocalculus aciditolerans]